MPCGRHGLWPSWLWPSRYRPHPTTKELTVDSRRIHDGGRGGDGVGRYIYKEFVIVRQQTASRQHITVLRPNSANNESLVCGWNAVSLLNLKQQKPPRLRVDYYNVSKKTVQTYFFVRTLSNFDRL